MLTRQAVARFEQERQALACMDDPNIAKVFDAGATDTGRPATDKLSSLLRLKYNNAIADAFADLGRPEVVGEVFTDFQQYLYGG